MSRGDHFRLEAEKTVQSTNFGLTSIFGFGKQQKFEDAADNFVKAGNAYKLDNNWITAAEMFVKAAHCHEQAESATDSVNDLVNAGNCYKKVDPAKAIAIYIKVINKYNENGRFGQSAKYHQEIAEMFETEGNIENAVKHYNSSAELYMNENKPLSAQPCFLKIASLYAKAHDYIKASDIFEKIGRDSLQSRLGAFSAKNYFFQSLLCILAAGDNVASQSKIESYKAADHTFGSSRECGFIEKLAQVCRC